MRWGYTAVRDPEDGRKFVVFRWRGWPWARYQESRTCRWDGYAWRGSTRPDWHWLRLDGSTGQMVSGRARWALIAELKKFLEGDNLVPWKRVSTPERDPLLLQEAMKEVEDSL